MTGDEKDRDRDELVEEQLDAVSGGIEMGTKLPKSGLPLPPLAGLGSVTNPGATKLASEKEADDELRPRSRRRLR